MHKTLSAKELKGAPLSILFVMLRPDLRGTNISSQIIADETGYSKRTVEDALGYLDRYGYTVCIGTLGRGGEKLYALAADCPMLFPVTPATLQRSEESAERCPADGQTEKQRSENSAEREPEKHQRSADSAERPELRVKSINSITLNTDSDSGAPDPDFERHYKRALQLGGVYPNIRRKLAAELAEEGPDYLPDLLGHLAYWHANQITQQLGAYISDAAKHRDLAPDGYRPPADLDFEAAFAWAKNGGRTEAELAAQRERDLVTRTALTDEDLGGSPDPQPVPDPSPPKPPDDPRDLLWQSILARLKLEMSPGAFHTWLSNTKLRRADRVGMIFEVACPNQHTLDWLANRLPKNIQRILRQVLGLHDEAIINLVFTVAS